LPELIEGISKGYIEALKSLSSTNPHSHLYTLSDNFKSFLIAPHLDQSLLEGLVFTIALVAW